MNFGVFLTTFGMVLLMEMGDKTQLLVMALASKYKPMQVLLGIAISIIALNFLAVTMGSVIGGIKVIQDSVKAVASLLFIFFGLLSLRQDKEESNTGKATGAGAIMAVALAFFVAEFGDKTQLSTFSFAALYPNEPASVFTGSTIALLAADCIGLIAGAVALKYIPERVMALISATLFILFGLFNGWATLRENFGIDFGTATVVIVTTAFIALSIAAAMIISQRRKIGS